MSFSKSNDEYQPVVKKYTRDTDFFSASAVSPSHPLQPYRARLVRIQSVYNCKEQRVVIMSAPFRGFAAFVRFHCRAKVHTVQKISLNEPSDRLMPVSPNSSAGSPVKPSTS